jgi:1-acyl-sn-glycerol-3-phosphate acyltransferase
VKADLLFYRFCRGAVAGFSRIWWRESIEGQEHVPADGAFVLAPVHRSNVDTLLAATVTRRRMRFMGKDSLWSRRWSAWLLSALGGFPVHRGTADREALRQCEEVLRGGEPLVIFPEGTRRSGPKVIELFEGAAYVAARAGVPIIPVGIGNSEAAMPRGSKFLKPVRITVIVGPPILPPPPAGDGARVPRRVVHELTTTLGAELQLLFDEAQGRAGAQPGVG